MKKALIIINISKNESMDLAQDIKKYLESKSIEADYINFDGFCDNWNRIVSELDGSFFEAIELILQSRKEKAIAERERAINNLTEINKSM